MEQELLTTADVCALLKVTRKTLYRYLREADPLPVVGWIGGTRPRYDRAAVLAWVARTRGRRGRRKGRRRGALVF